MVSEDSIARVETALRLPINKGKGSDFHVARDAGLCLQTAKKALQALVERGRAKHTPVRGFDRMRGKFNRHTINIYALVTEPVPAAQQPICRRRDSVEGCGVSGAHIAHHNVPCALGSDNIGLQMDSGRKRRARTLGEYEEDWGDR